MIRGVSTNINLGKIHLFLIGEISGFDKIDKVNTHRATRGEREKRREVLSE